ncbi:MAG: SH3 domain-containing protein [Chloroflexi bacterium]|nr:SH3 domain-containing protein [Chloroflexota bacterium]
MLKRFFVMIVVMGCAAVRVYAQNADHGRGWVGEQQVNVRATPGTRGAIVGQLAPGTELILHGREDTAGNGLWVYMTPAAGGITGWVLSDFLLFPVTLDLNALPVVAGGGAAATAATAVTPVPAASVSVPEGGLAGTTRSPVNLRSGPGTNYSILRRLPGGTTVIIVGRNAASSWLSVRVDGQAGWLSARFVSFGGGLNALPVSDGTNAASAPAAAGMAGVVPAISGTARQIYLNGQNMGNRRAVFSKVGDSITASSLFLYPIGLGGAQLGAYSALQPVIDFYLTTTARTSNSFANDSLAARSGWTSFDLLDPARGEQVGCNGQAPLLCEYTTVRPALALIMIGTNDAMFGVSGDQFRANLQTIVQTTISMGIIPVLSTIPDNTLAPDRVGEYNGIISGVAAAYDIPLWNYWAALQGLPGRGLSGDGVHPSSGVFESGVFSADALIYGYNMRNLTALLVLDAVWRGALY